MQVTNHNNALQHHADRVLATFVNNNLDNAQALLSIASTLTPCKRRTAAITKAGKILRLINALEPHLHTTTTNIGKRLSGEGE